MEPKDNDILYIDLTNRIINKEMITLELRRKYIGGAGINTKILFDSEAMHHGPFSEKNTLIFGVGPAVGTGLLAGNRCTITAKGPINEMYADSNVGGNFTLRMRSVGIDHLVITGKASELVYLYIDEHGEVEIIAAPELKGLTTEKLTDVLQERHGATAEIACIGPAGENLVRFASVIISRRHAAGRAGLGCIMGSKNLKAIVIQGTKLNIPSICDKTTFNKIKKTWIEKSRISVISKMASMDGTLFLIESYNKAKCLPINNCQVLSSEKVKEITAQVFKFRYQTKKRPCYACTIGCAKEFEIKEGKYSGEKGERIDYGSAGSLGPNLGIFDWGSILHLKMLLDYLGMDTIECGMLLGMLFEGYQRGAITPTAVDGMDLRFGDSDQVEELINKIAYRIGVGDILAEGTYRAGIALKAEKYAFCVKKQGTGLLSKGRVAYSLAYLTSTRSGDHLKGFPFSALVKGFFAEVVGKNVFKTNVCETIDTSQEKGRIVWWHENYKYIVDSLGLCLFVVQGLPNTGHAFFDEFALVMNALFDLKMTEKEVFYAAERVYQLQNAFNVACGLKVGDYKWPKRTRETENDEVVLKETALDDPFAPGLLPEYFYFRGLSKDGKPTAARFADLGMSFENQKADVLEADEAATMAELLKLVNLSITISRGEKFKCTLISKVFIKLLDLKEQKERKHFEKMVGIKNSNKSKQIK